MLFLTQVFQLQYNLKNKGVAPCTIKSFTHMATKSIPMVSNFLNLLAKSIFVPTPSVQETITGSFILELLMSKTDPKPPMLSVLILYFVFLTFF